MGAINSTPIPFIATGLYDSLDGTNAPVGACSALSNLVPDRSTTAAWTCRPSAVQKIIPPGTGQVVVAINIGTRIYGLYSNGSGYDVPFCYDMGTTAFVTITGATSSNTPTTQSLAGDWTPPQIQNISTKIIITHPGFNGSSGNFFGVINIATLSAPTWTSQNTSGTALPSVPTFVAQYYNRAWFACGNIAYYSDVLSPTNLTNATQSITVGDTNRIYAMANQSVDTSSGGQNQSLTIFKQTSIYQVSGDATGVPQALALTPLRGEVGTTAPNSIANAPDGTYFLAIDGIRIVNSQGSISAPIEGIQVPFVYAQYPSRCNGMYNNNVYRISVYNGNVSGTPFQEFFYHIDLEQWSGPHSFPSQAGVSYQGTFLVAPIGVAGLWQSDVVPNSASSFVENGTQLTFTMTSAPLPDVDMAMKNIGESTIDIAFQGAIGAITVTILNAQNYYLGSAAVVNTAANSVWGSFVWGYGAWGASATGFKRYNLNWSNPITTEKFVSQVMGNSFNGLKIGNQWFRVEDLGYTNASVG
jgi:hypothetical protein